MTWNGAPDSWSCSTLDEVCLKIQDGTHFSPKQQATSGRYKYVTAKNVRSWGLDLSDMTYVDEIQHRAIYLRCDPRKGDVLLVKDGVNTGDAALNTLDEEFSLLSSVCLLRANSVALEGAFLRYFLLSPAGYRLLTGKMTGTAIKRIILRRIKETPVPLAPLPEQHRIVAEIEKHFTRLDAAVAALQRVRANLKRYRATVLKAACEGRLVPTEAELARAEGHTYEPADQLLARILKERRTNAANDRKNDGIRLPEGESPADIREGWCVCTLGQIAECLDSRRVPVNKRERARRVGNVPYYGANGQVGWIDDYIFDEPLVLVVEDETFTGRTQSFSYMIRGKTWVNNHAHVLRATAGVTTEFLNHTLAHYPFTPRTTGTTGRRKLTQKALMTAPVVLPPLAEQHRIVAEVERRLSVIDELDAVVDANLKRAERLRQAILKRAFEGKLVPQDPNDEPASVLLERIRAEHRTMSSTGKIRSGRSHPRKVAPTDTARTG